MWLNKKKYDDLLYRLAYLENKNRYLTEEVNKGKGQILEVCPHGCESIVYQVSYGTTHKYYAPTKLKKVRDFLICPECKRTVEPIEPLSLKELTLLAYGYTEIKEVDNG